MNIVSLERYICSSELIRSSQSYLWSMTLKPNTALFCNHQDNKQIYWVVHGKNLITVRTFYIVISNKLYTEQLVYFNCTERILALSLTDSEGHTTKWSNERSVIYNHITWYEIPPIPWIVSLRNFFNLTQFNTQDTLLFIKFNIWMTGKYLTIYTTISVQIHVMTRIQFGAWQGLD